MAAPGENRQGEGQQGEMNFLEKLGGLGSSLLRLWVMYFALFAALLGMTVLLGLMPQFVSLPWLGTGFGAKALQLVAYPLLAGFQALKVQVLVVDVVEEQAFELGFPRSRAVFLAAPRLPAEKAWAVDRGIGLLLGLCVAAGLGFGVLWTARGDPLGVISGFVVGSLQGFSALATIQIIVELVISVTSAGSSEAEQASLDDPEAATREKPSGGLRAMLVGVACLGLTILLQLGIALLAWKFSIPPSLISAAMVIAFLAMGVALVRIFKDLVERPSRYLPFTTPFRIVLGLFAFVCLFVLVVPQLLGRGQPDWTARLSTPFFSPPPNGTAFNRSFVPPGLLSGFGTYPVCHNMEWNKSPEDEAKHLQLLDIVTFAQAVYWPVEADVLSELRSATSGTDLGEVHLEALEDPSAIGRVGVFALPQAKVRVVAIRGSNTPDDWFFNFDLWGPSVLFLGLRNFMPFAELVPVEVARRALALDLRELLGLPAPWRRLQERVHEAVLRSREDGFRLLVTGHSLGGGLAQIVGPLEGIPTVIFSPVGVSLTASRTGLADGPELPVENSVVIVSPHGDPVPSKLDDQQGVEQNIMCTSRSPLDCHSLRQTACELFRRCGDPRGRSMEAACSQQVGEDWQAVPWQGFAWRS